MKTMQTDSGRTVGHLPIEISRATKFLMDRDAEVIVKLTETHYRRSPLVQGGLEIPCVLVAKMNGYSVRNQMLLQKHLELVNDLYAEPKNEEILGSYMVPCIEPDPKRTAPISKNKERIPKRKGSDIRSLFKRIENQNRQQNNEFRGEVKEEDNSIIVID